MASAPTAYAKDTQPILPDALYPYSAFIRCAGVPKSKIREAKLAGIELETIDSGRRKYVLGHVGIAFIQAMAKRGI